MSMRKPQRGLVFRLTAVLLTGALLAGSLTGCASNQGAPAQSSQVGTEQPQPGESANLTPEQYEAAYQAEPAAKRVIHIGYNGGLCQAPIAIAQEKGFFEAEGLNTELTRAEDTRDAIVGGKIDTSAGMVAGWLKPITSGVDLVFTVGLHTGCASAIALTDSPINSFADAKGKVVAINGGIGGIYHNIAYRLIAHDGYVPGDFTWKDFPAEQALQVLQKGEASIAVLADQLAEKWVQEGLVKRIRSTTLDEDFKNETCCVLGISGDFIRENPVTAEKITRAIYKASLWVEENKEETAQILLDNKHISGSVDYAVDLLKLYNYNVTNDGTEKSIYDSIDEYKALGVIDQNLDAETFKKQVWHRFELEDLKN